MLIYNQDCNSGEITLNMFCETWQRYSSATEKIQSILCTEGGGS